MKHHFPPTIPAIVVVGYNRPHTLKRLFASLLAAEYPSNVNIPLVISLDFCVEDVANEAKKLVESIQWPHGIKDVLCHPVRLGLKEHVLTCGDLTAKFESIIVLEDDLFVSPEYYLYASAALDFYRDDNRISGISLYAHRNNPYLRKPFEPLNDGTDIFFLQFASSWGQVWNKEQWSSFKNWYNKGQGVYADDPLPDEVIAWPDTSWLKLFIKYMVECNKIFVYPRVSLSTNFGDPGTHFKNRNLFFQVPILLKSKKYHFVSLDDSLSVYDAFFELEARILNKFTDVFHGEKYTIDLYGSKNPSKVKAVNMLTTQECILSHHSYGAQMNPLVSNIMANIPGKDIKYTTTDHVVKWEGKNNIRKISGGRRACNHLLKKVCMFIYRKISGIISKAFNCR